MRTSTIAVLVSAALALAACGGAATPTLTPTATAASRATEAPKPTATPPTSAPIATAKPTEAPKPTAVLSIPTPTPPLATRPITLTASMALVADMLRNLTAGIEGVKVNTVVPLGSDPHDFEPTPADIRTVSGASALFVIGAGYEEAWLDKLIRSAGGNRPMIEATSGIELHEAEHRHGEEKGGDEHEKDPHIWMDPQRWGQAALNMAGAIATLDPAIAGAVNANAAAFTARLAELDAYVKAEAAKLAPDRRVLVTSHDAFGYYADRYGFQVVGAVLPTSAAGAPSAREVKALVDQIKAHRVKAIFLEAGLNPKLTEAVAKEAGAQVVERLYVDTLSDPAGLAPTYIDLIRHNTKTIVDALR